MKENQVISHLVCGLGYKTAQMMTKENELIKGISLVFRNKAFLTITKADTKWVDDDGEEYGLAIDDRILFIGKIAMGFQKYTKSER